VEELRFPENFRSPPISDGEETVHRVNPKAALVWDPFSFVTFRGIYAKSLGGVSLDESFRLEPTQLAGFGQAFRSIIPESLVGSVAAPDFETWGAAMDWKFATRTYFSVQGDILKSRVRETVGMFDFNDFNTPIVPSSTLENLDFKEQSIGASLNQLVGDEWSFGAQYRFSRAELNTRFPEIPLFLPGSSQFDRADLQQARAYGLFNHPSGFFASAESEWYWQHNAEASSNLKDDAFAQVNLYAGYRFPRQHVTLTFGVLNVGDQDYRLNPLNYYYELPRERVFFTRLLINF
jgi:outer membrane receptor protein involved in Fe transport